MAGGVNPCNLVSAKLQMSILSAKGHIYRKGFKDKAEAKGRGQSVVSPSHNGGIQFMLRLDF